MKKFKLDMISQSYQRDNIKQLANELSIRPELIHRWRSQYEQAKELFEKGI